MVSPHIKPYIFAREGNRPRPAGSAYAFKWFDENPILIDPLKVASVEFANHVLHLDQIAFKANGLLTPRWVFYDCAVMPGLISGFAARTSSLSKELRVILNAHDDMEWTPLSLFITIPTPEKGRWMAHNLGSVNSVLSKEERFRGLGFLSKGFGLWYANIRELYGVAQWNSPALKLHANYGPLEIVTAYTPIHDYANSITYRVWVDTLYWDHFLDPRKTNAQFHEAFDESGLFVDTSAVNSMMEVQMWIEEGKTPLYIDPQEILLKPTGAVLKLYRKKLR